MLQGELGPDGAKGDRGEPGMTVSARALPWGSIWRCWHLTAHARTYAVDIRVVFVSLLCSAPLFISNSGGWSQIVRSLWNESALWWVFHASCISNLLELSPSRTLDGNHSTWVTAWAKLCESVIEKKLHQCHDLKLTFIIRFSFCFLPVHLCDPQRVEVSEPFSRSTREEGGQKGCEVAWVTVVYYTSYAAVVRWVSLIYIINRLQCIHPHLAFLQILNEWNA